jgi:hypothetical protein
MAAPQSLIQPSFPVFSTPIFLLEGKVKTSFSENSKTFAQEVREDKIKKIKIKQN